MRTPPSVSGKGAAPFLRYGGLFLRDRQFLVTGQKVLVKLVKKSRKWSRRGDLFEGVEEVLLGARLHRAREVHVLLVHEKARFRVSKGRTSVVSCQQRAKSRLFSRQYGAKMCGCAQHVADTSGSASAVRERVWFCVSGVQEEDVCGQQLHPDTRSGAF